MTLPLIDLVELRCCISALLSIFAIMLVQTASIHGLKRADYDDLLARGWFRGNGIVYRSEVVCIDSKVYGIRNIRFPVGAFSMRKSHRKLFLKNQNRFTVRIGTPQCDARREELYQGLKSRFKAFVHETLEGVLLSPRLGAEFDAMEIAIYHEERLVAVSYVDVGDRSMASILCIYDQAYRKDSLGMFTMLAELDLAKRLGLDYYYPGYVLDEPSAFDYKLTLGPCEWLSNGEVWSKSQMGIPISKGAQIRSKMSETCDLIHSAGYNPTLFIYPFYTLGHLLLERPDLIRVPSYYTIETDAGTLAVSYDLQMDAFICFDLHAVNDLDFLHSLQLSDDYSSGASYQLEPRRCTFFHKLRSTYFQEDLAHIIQLMSRAVAVEDNLL
jgi:arginyl-tRNA--protein-N-Asp/Glu arginylyltransferase